MVSRHSFFFVLFIAYGLGLKLSAPFTAVVNQSVNVTWTKDPQDFFNGLTLEWSQPLGSGQVEGSTNVPASTGSGVVTVVFLHTGQYFVAAFQQSSVGNDKRDRSPQGSGKGGEKDPDDHLPSLQPLTFLTISVQKNTSDSTAPVSFSSSVSTVGVASTSGTSPVPSAVGRTTTSGTSSVSSKTPLIVGIVLGTTVTIIVLLTAVCILRRRKRRLLTSSLVLAQTPAIYPFITRQLRNEELPVSFHTKRRRRDPTDQIFAPVGDGAAGSSPDIAQLRNELDDLKREMNDLRLRTDPSPPDYSLQ